MAVTVRYYAEYVSFSKANYVKLVDSRPILPATKM